MTNRKRRKKISCRREWRIPVYAQGKRTPITPYHKYHINNWYIEAQNYGATVRKITVFIV